MFKSLARLLSSPTHAADTPYRYAPEASIALHAASSLSGLFRKKTQFPETVLLALLGDEAVCASWRGDTNAAASTLEEAILATKDGESDREGWHPRASLALHAAWDRAAARARPVTRGDLLSGLAGAGGLVGTLVREGSPDFVRLDASDPPIGGEPAADIRADDRVRIVIVNDDTTTQDFVLEMLRERFGLTHLRARHVTFRTHFLGEAVVCEDAFEAATERTRDAEAAARSAGFPLRFRLATK